MLALQTVWIKEISSSNYCPKDEFRPNALHYFPKMKGKRIWIKNAESLWN
jgi:hypothetical protein